MLPLKRAIILANDYKTVLIARKPLQTTPFGVVPWGNLGRMSFRLLGNEKGNIVNNLGRGGLVL